MSQSIRSEAIAEQLLSVEAAAERLDTKPRFIRRLIAERRIEYHKVGRHVRISESALAEFIESGRVLPVSGRRRGRAALWRGSVVLAGCAGCRPAVIRHVTGGLTGWITPRRALLSPRPTRRSGSRGWSWISTMSSG